MCQTRRSPKPYSTWSLSRQAVDEPTATYPRTLILVGRHSKLTVVESYVGLSQRPYFTDSVAEIVVDEGGSLEHYRYLNESPEAYHIGTTRVRLGKDSQFRSTSFARGAALARNDLQVVLDAPGGSCDLNGLYLTSGRQHIDNHIDIDHAKPHTSSEQYFKGVLADRSQAVFSGRVLVRPDAQKTYARQRDKNLLLSKGARVNTKPSLEIFADDVQCFHGATAGAVADEALFYMRSRGIDEDTARALLVHGFASEIIERVSAGAPERLPEQHVLESATKRQQILGAPRCGIGACLRSGYVANHERNNGRSRRAIPRADHGPQLEAAELPCDGRRQPVCERVQTRFCGDTVTLYLKLDGDVVSDVAFQGSGCTISKASASMLTESIKGKTTEEADGVFDRFHRMLTRGPRRRLRRRGAGRP